MIGSQAAKAEQAARDRMGPPAKAEHELPTPPGLGALDEVAIRDRALVLAQEAVAFGIITPERVLETATTYTAFIKGESNG